jgi:hypothetical protein
MGTGNSKNKTNPETHCRNIVGQPDRRGRRGYLSTYVPVTLSYLSTSFGNDVDMKRSMARADGKVTDNDSETVPKGANTHADIRQAPAAGRRLNDQPTGGNDNACIPQPIYDDLIPATGGDNGTSAMVMSPSSGMMDGVYETIQTGNNSSNNNNGSDNVYQHQENDKPPSTPEQEPHYEQPITPTVEADGRTGTHSVVINGDNPTFQNCHFHMYVSASSSNLNSDLIAVRTSPGDRRPEYILVTDNDDRKPIRQSQAENYVRISRGARESDNEVRQNINVGSPVTMRPNQNRRRSVRVEDSAQWPRLQSGQHFRPHDGQPAIRNPLPLLSRKSPSSKFPPPLPSKVGRPRVPSYI